MPRYAADIDDAARLRTADVFALSRHYFRRRYMPDSHACR